MSKKTKHKEQVKEKSREAEKVNAPGQPLGMGHSSPSGVARQSPAQKVRAGTAREAPLGDAGEASLGEQSVAVEESESGVQGADEKVVDELRAAQDEIADLKDKLLRAHAEMDNLRKRSQREIANAHKFGVEKFATALLDVVDNLERALDAEEGNEADLREGVRLTLDSCHGMMKKFEMERVDAVGEIFDPHRHEALSQIPSDEQAGTVVGQHVAGYTLHGRLIRPAKVLVSSGPAETGKG